MARGRHSFLISQGVLMRMLREHFDIPEDATLIDIAPKHARSNIEIILESNEFSPNAEGAAPFAESLQPKQQ